jgi:predicted PurR-regulated permease PerM
VHIRLTAAGVVTRQYQKAMLYRNAQTTGSWAMARVWNGRGDPSTIDASAPATPIYLPARARTRLIGIGIGLVLLLLWRAPTVLTLAIGGLAIALLLSFPVRLLARIMPRSAAIGLSFVLLAGLVIAIVLSVLPMLVDQLSALLAAAPDVARRIGERVPSLVGRLSGRGLRPTGPQQLLDTLKQELLSGAQTLLTRVIGQVGGAIAGAANLLANAFGVVFVAAYLLADARTIHAAILRATPHGYRRDVQGLWHAFALTLSRYLGGLVLALIFEGSLSAIGLYLLGVPYAALLGVLVLVTGLIPYLGAWIGAVPAVLIALSISPTTALLTMGLYLLVQQLEGNVLTPRLQGNAVHVHPLIIFLGVVVAAELWGVAGAVIAIPIMAVLRVLFDFFRARLRFGSDAVVPIRGAGASVVLSSLT